jgi:hypothetical protein
MTISLFNRTKKNQLTKGITNQNDFSQQNQHQLINQSVKLRTMRIKEGNKINTNRLTNQSKKNE